MKTYAVALVFTKNGPNGSTDITCSLASVNAGSKEEAFGMAYDTSVRKYHGYGLSMRSVIEMSTSTPVALTIPEGEESPRICSNCKLFVSLCSNKPDLSCFEPKL